MASFLSTLFGGGSEREAADRNRASYGLYQTGANAALNSGLDRSVGAVTQGADYARNAYGQNYSLYGDLGRTGTGILDTGRADSLAALGTAGGLYGDLASKYGQGTDLYLDSLGVNGAAGNTRAQDSFQTGPGYEFTRDQGLEALNRRRNAAGMLNSGNADIDALKFGTGLADQTYGSWQDRLAGLISPELAATQGQAGVYGNMSNVINADTAARLGLASGVTQGQAGANSAAAANDVALGNTLGGLYTGDATNRVGVLGNVTSGNVAASNQQAAGEASGARNLLNAGMGLASLAAGGMGGGGLGGSFGSLFGGQMANGYNVGSTGGVNPFPTPYGGFNGATYGMGR